MEMSKNAHDKKLTSSIQGSLAANVTFTPSNLHCISGPISILSPLIVKEEGSACLSFLAARLAYT